MKKDTVISVTRVTAMVMIVLCHVFMFLKIDSLAQTFNVGVDVFFIISGILFANRKINNEKEFLQKRWLKISTPMYIFLIFVFSFNILKKNKDAWFALPTYFLNLQGFNFLINNLALPTIPDLIHLWFMTVIMLCYILLIAMKRFEKKRSDTFYKDTKSVAKVFIVLLITSCLIAYLNINLVYFLAFFCGYILGKRNSEVNTKKYLLVTLLMIIAMALRVTGKMFLDETILYNNIIVYYTHFALAYWIYQTIKFVSKACSKLFDFISSNEIIKWLDERSMHIYITHHVFLNGVLSVECVKGGIIFQLSVFIILTLISASILKILSDNVINFLSRKEKKLLPK